MLSNIDLDDKGYDQIREESIAQIPVYSREWTNYNISDPGITILENFSAFAALQQSELNEISEKTKQRLLALIGFTARRGKCATAYLLPQKIEKTCLPPRRMKLYAQDICFELTQYAPVKEMRILAVRTERAGQNLEALLDRHGVKGGYPLFGEQPAGGEKVYFSLSDVPEADQRVAIFVELAQQFHRNPFAEERSNPFAEVLWEVETQEGYASLKVEDNTHCLLQSGFVVFSLNEKLRGSLARGGAENAYRMRITLVRADYDLVPRIQRICGLLIPAVQRDTQSDVMVVPVTNGKVCIRHWLIHNGYLEVYGKEADGKYHRYYDGNCADEYSYDRPQRKRFYQTKYTDDFTAVLTFSEYGSAKPGVDKLPQEALVVCRGKELMVHSSLGRLYGYDNQELPLPGYGVAYAQDFSVLVVEQGAEGDALCHVVMPENRTVGEVYYSVSEKDYKIIVHDCGQYEGARLSLGTVVFYEGDGGNIRAETELKQRQRDLQLDFVNCTDVTDGSFAEDFEQVRQRFAADLTKPATMVTHADCEQLVKSVPGLSIHKIGVCPAAGQNELHIVVKPNSLEAFPRLSDIYLREISHYLEQYRMLTTKLLISQPVYVPIHVNGTVSVQKYYVHNREKIEETLRELLDGIHSDVRFGSRIIFHELYCCLERLDCVEEIRDLSVFPGSSQWADKVGMDIQLKPNALYYSGDLHIEIIG